MQLPRKLKNMNLFQDGGSFQGSVSEVTLPDLERQMEAWRGGGMDGQVEIDMGAAGPIVLEHKYGGYMPEILAGFGAARADATQLRFAGAYQSDNGGYDRVEVVVRGRHKTIGRGAAKAGEDTEKTVSTTCVYYKEVFNGRTMIEIDVLNMVFIVDGVDRLAEQRAAIGL